MAAAKGAPVLEQNILQGDGRMIQARGHHASALSVISECRSSGDLTEVMVLMATWTKLLSRGDILVPQNLLNGKGRHMGFEKMSGEGMPEHVHAAGLFDFRQFFGILED
jgi:hypothetical protein